MPNGYFERTDPSPIKLRLQLDKPIQIISQGQVIYADYVTYKDVVGFKFVGWTAPTPKGTISGDAKAPTTIYRGESINIVSVKGHKQAPHKEFLENIRKQQEKTDVKFTEEKTPETVSETVPSLITEPPPPIPSPEENKESDKIGLTTYLKKFTNKNWFIMKKETAREYLNRLEIDFSNVANNKSELIRFLKEKVKEL